MAKINPITFGMAFKSAVESANTQGLFDPDSVQSRFVELLTVLENVAPEYEVNLAEDNRSSGGGSSERELPQGANIFTYDGDQWIDFRGSKEVGKDKGGVVSKHPDFKSFDYQQSVWMYSQEGDPNEEAAELVKAADAAESLV